MHKYKYIRKLIYILADNVSIIAAWYISVWIYSYLFINKAPILQYINIYFYLLFIVNTGIFWLFGMYKKLWRYAGFDSYIQIVLAALLSNFIIYVIFRLLMGHWQSPAIPVMAFFCELAFCGAIRVAPKLLRRWRAVAKQRTHKVELQPALIVGAGRLASSYLAELKDEPTPKYHVVGMVDDDPNKTGMWIHGVEVIGTTDNIADIVENMNVKVILLAITSATNEQLNRIISKCPLNECKVLLIPNMNSNYKNIGELKEFDVTDLLPRDETNLDISSIEALINGKTILVTGGGGSIGSELCRQLLQFDVKKLVIYDIYENNAYDIFQEIKCSAPDLIERVKIRIGSVQKTERLEEVFAEFKPSVVFHAAAYKHVPLMEQAPRLAIENNVLGTFNTALMSEKYGVKKFVFISTDKAVNPTNIMGASKRICEEVLLSFNKESKTEFVCVRFGNVLGSNGSVVPIFTRQIKNGGPVIVTHREITRYFMTIREAALLVIEAAAMAKGGEIFVLDMGKPVKIKDLAESMIRLAGFIPYVDIPIEFSGLRPGEKLYEELSIDNETMSKTVSDKIYTINAVASVPNYYKEIIESLTNALNSREKLVKLISKYVPELHKQEIDAEDNN